MLNQYIVYTTNGVFCIEDDSELGACEQALLMFEYPEYERVLAVKHVYICGYPY